MFHVLSHSGIQTEISPQEHDYKKKTLTGSREGALGRFFKLLAINFTGYTDAKTLFRKEMFTAESQREEQEYNELQKASEIDQNTFQKMFRRKKNNGPPKYII